MEIKLIDPEITSSQPSNPESEYRLRGYYVVDVRGVLPLEYNSTGGYTEVIFAGCPFSITSFDILYIDGEFVRTVTMRSYMTYERMSEFMRNVPSCTLTVKEPEPELERLKFDNSIDCLELEI